MHVAEPSTSASLPPALPPALPGTLAGTGLELPHVQVPPFLEPLRDSFLGYANRTGRPPGTLVNLLGGLFVGVGLVRDQTRPWAHAWHLSNLAALQRDRRRWFVLGDSLAQGIGASRPGAGWVRQLADRLCPDHPDVDVVNLSATGAAVADVVDQQLPVMRSLLRPGEHPLAVVMIGFNDLYGGLRTRRRMAESFASLLALLPRGSVISTMPRGGARVVGANRHIARAAADGRVRMVDMVRHGPASWRVDLAEDWFHPDDTGHARIADAFHPVVRDALATFGA